MRSGCGRLLLASGLVLVTRVTLAQTPDSLAAPSARERLQSRIVSGARRGVDVLFEADSVTSAWTTRQDHTSRFFRAAAPVAFWVPPAMVVAAPMVWAQEADDGHAINAQYARAATQGLAIGFVASRITKSLIHRARPCTGDSPGAFGNPSDSAAQCPRERIVGSYASFFSEHTMAAFSVATAVAFEAQRRNEPRVELISAVGVTAASFVGIGRLYSRHHWLSDVLVGAAVGAASGFAGAALSGKPVDRHK